MNTPGGKKCGTVLSVEVFSDFQNGILANNRVNKSKDVFMAVIPGDLYHTVKQVSENCPVKAIIIEKIEE